MSYQKVALGAAFFVTGLLSFSNVFAQLPIDGVADKTVYKDAVSARVPAQAGFTYSAWLNGQPMPVGVFTNLNHADYYELAAQRTEIATGFVSNRLVRFIVAAGERVDTEWGLPPQTPFPTMSSSSNEFAGAHLRVIAPQQFPLGYEIPVVAWVENGSGHAVRGNGWLTADGQPSIQIRRGTGSGFLSATNPAGPLNYAAQMAGLHTNKLINIQESTSWTTVSGVLNGNVTWPSDARVQVTGDLTVAGGASLTVGSGTIVRAGPGVTITNNGLITIQGTVEQPVVFMPDSRTQPWGGFVQHANNASLVATGAIFTGSGAKDCWFLGHECSTSLSGISSHRGEQALISLLGANCNVTMTDCAAVELAGQWGHAAGSGGSSYRITLTRFLMRQATTGGEFTRANFTVNDSAFLECPDDTSNFVDGDNDALYLVGGTHAFTNTMFGWTKDDAIDCGGTDSSGTGFGQLAFQSCWFEATFHEGNALSGYKNVVSRDSVYFNCGQGFEDGYNAPTGRVDHCLFIACQSGVRFGDNYPSIGNYDGRVTATNCILLNNHRDLFGYNWHTGGGWTNAWGQMFASNNFITAADTNFPNNRIWDPAADGWRLSAFGAPGRVGIGFAILSGQTLASSFPDGLPVNLSLFCTNPVAVAYAVEASSGARQDGTLIFVPGQVRKFIPLPAFAGVLRVSLANPVNADISGPGELYFQIVAVAPVRAILGRLGEQRVIYWGDATFHLEQARTLPASGWIPIPQASPIPISMSNPASFYRLAR